MKDPRLKDFVLIYQNNLNPKPKPTVLTEIEKMETYSEKKNRLKKSRQVADNAKEVIKQKPIIRLKMGEGRNKREVESYRDPNKPIVYREDKLPKKRKLSDVTNKIGVWSEKGISVEEMALKTGLTSSKVRLRIGVFKKYKEINNN